MNGFWVYVPRFDLRAPIFLSDAEGNIQIDPTLVGLEPQAGQPPTLAFANAGKSRMFPSGKCSESPDSQFLEVRVPEGRPFVVRTLDVVTVLISCDDWDVRARVPFPRLHLIGKGIQAAAKSPQELGATKITSNRLQDALLGKERTKGSNVTVTESSLYEELMRLSTPPVLSQIPLRHQNQKSPEGEDRKATMIGRLVFGEFVNPDTRSATQEAAIEAAAEAAAQRRGQVMANQARNKEYDTTRRIEMDVTSRNQKLAAGKRNVRKAKGK
jgi:hypothetical protein